VKSELSAERNKVTEKNGPPPPAPPAQVYATSPSTAGSGNRISFRFHGSGSEYFRIWLVNSILSLLTLGVYSAWAKVRRKRYFYGNTRLLATENGPAIFPPIP